MEERWKLPGLSPLTARISADTYDRFVHNFRLAESANVAGGYPLQLFSKRAPELRMWTERGDDYGVGIDRMLLRIVARFHAINHLKTCGHSVENANRDICHRRRR
jgi:hypothetical protein